MNYVLANLADDAKLGDALRTIKELFNLPDDAKPKWYLEASVVQEAEDSHVLPSKFPFQLVADGKSNNPNSVGFQLDSLWEPGIAASSLLLVNCTISSIVWLLQPRTANLACQNRHVLPA